VIASAAETAALAASVPDAGGVVLVPALSGLGAPHWRPEARASLSGMSFATTRAHLARAALEATANQTRDLMEAFAADGAPWESLRIDGGMSANDWLAQDLADVLGIAVERPAMVETTALGAAMLAAVASGWFASLEEAGIAMRGDVRRFAPRMDEAVRNARLGAWREALAKV
jgi:glycerol kinase